MRKVNRLQILTVVLLISLSLWGFRSALNTLFNPHYKNIKNLTIALTLIQDNYIKEVPEDKLIEGAIQGMVFSLQDPNSHYLPREVYQVIKEMETGEYGGIGVTVSMKDDKVVVVSPIEDTPGEKAGIKPGDIIVRVNGESCQGKTLLEIVNEIKGPPGTKVNLTIEREGLEQPLELEIIREIVKTKMVKSQMLEGKIGYIRITNFGNKVGDKVEKALEGLEKEGMRGLILDLRNNPGGMVGEAVEVADKFLSRGLITYTRGRTGRENFRYEARKEGTHPSYPLVVLINGGSASASEIVAGAFQYHRRAEIVGSKSYGKGSVQARFELRGGSALNLTVARYYLPDGQSIEGKGIEPDIKVEEKEGKDLALEKAQEVIKREIGN